MGASGGPGKAQQLDLAAAAALPATDVLSRLGSSPAGLSSVEAGRRLAVYGPNVLLSHGVSALSVLVRQLRSYLLLLLLAAAVVSAVVGDRTEAAIIGGIMLMSVGLSFLNEFRSEKAVEALHSQIRHLAFVDRDGQPTEVAVTEIVPGDVVHLRVGDVIPADLRLLEAHELECDESVLTGESRVAAKTADAHPPGESSLDLQSCTFMGTVVQGGDGRGLVVCTGACTAFGAIAIRLGERQAQTSFQNGLQAFSRLLATVTVILAGSIFVINAALGRSLLQSALFALAIAVGLTPQLLPAIVTVSLATGARRLAQRQVIVKRLVCIEDLGNVDVLFTDKTGTLTEGHISFTQSLDCSGKNDDRVRALGLACSDKTGNELDRALHAAQHGDADRPALDRIPFDHERQIASALVDAPQGRMLIAKGAPEGVLARCATVPAEAGATLDRLFASGTRVVAVASRPATLDHLSRDDERDLSLDGFLCFTDPAKANVRESLARLAGLGITVKIVTGDNGQVAAHLCEQVGLAPGTVVTGPEIDAMDDAALLKVIPTTSIFARVTPEQKSRIIRAQRSLGADVGFLGDGVNDAIALHDADVGISVDSAADVAKDAADVVLLDKDLGIIADGVVEGRRIFANTIKYVLMGTSSNFGNMFSAAGASLFLSFLPMLPTQILLNNLLYDVSEMTIPTDNVDEALLARPSQWDIGLIRRFMAFFGPISSIYDFLTFGVMLHFFHAGPTLFRSGWFVESLTTQTLVIFVIRSRRVPFFKSRPSVPLLTATLACAAVGVALPYIGPFARLFGFRSLPLSFLAVLAGMIVTYLALAQLGVALFFKPQGGRSLARALGRHERHVGRRASRWSMWPHAAGGQT
ncbi:MAG TPA: magnesium-translocating P-type ATPase [Gaiellaceae bacterium]|nr:magnesium-translocating P-type ATPase [Gaiellaceae bacterium]